MKYRERITVVDAIQVAEDNTAEVEDFCDGVTVKWFNAKEGHAHLQPGELEWFAIKDGKKTCTGYRGEWVVREDGSFRVMADVAFRKAYEPAE